MAKTFSAQVDAWTRKSKARMRAVFQTAVQAVAEEANTPRGHGGRMPVDTNFLRNSQSGSLTGMPSGPSRKGEPQGNPDIVILTIAKADLGDTIWIGWTAGYGVYMNHRYAFRDAAVQKWQQQVDKAAAEARRRIP